MTSPAAPARVAAAFLAIGLHLSKVEGVLARIEGEADKLPKGRQRTIKAAIDPALLDKDVNGLERGIDELKKAIAAGEMP